MFKNDKKLIREEDFFKTLEFRDNIIKNRINNVELCSNNRKNLILKDIQSIKNQINSIKENFRKFKKEFENKNKAWNAIYEVIGELKNDKMVKEDIA